MSDPRAVEPPGRAFVASVNIGAVEEFEYQGRTETTGIFKRPVTERIGVTTDAFGDDRQADLHAHGGPDRIAYAYASEDLTWWSERLEREVGPGSMGENLTTIGLDVTHALIGEQWKVGSVVFEVSGLRTPCFKLGVRMGIPAFSTQFAKAGRPGAYLRVAQTGELGTGDFIEVIHRPDHGVTMAMLADAYHRDNSLAERLLDAPELEPGWRQWAEETVAAQSTTP